MTTTAVDGPRYRRLTEVLTMNPIRAGSMPLSLSAFAPGGGAVDEGHPLGPPEWLPT